ncbi:MAG: aldo/keto reductase [candidate division Zixibacteria bacterium]
MDKSKSNLSRRKFLSTAAAGLATTGLAGLTPQLSLAQEGEHTDQATQPEIIYRTLGKTGMKVPIVSMGAGGANNPGIIQAAYEKGIRHFDTAASYQYGQNEQMVGRVVNKLKVRDKVNIGTKVYTPGQRVEDPAAVKKKLIELCEGSLKRLKTDYVDILYIHSVATLGFVNNPGLQEGFAELKEQKKILAAGISTHSNMAAVINDTVEAGFYDVILTSMNISLGDNADLMAAVKNAANKGIGFVAMKTQAGGSRLSADQIAGYPNKTIHNAMLRWVMRMPEIKTSIPGIANYDFLNDNFEIAYSLEYTPEEEKLLSDSTIQLGMGFCHQCRQCLASCPHKTDIPTLMRTHMYAASYGDFYKARRVLNNIPRGSSLDACGSCDQCTAQCANSVRIRDNISELKTIYG